MTGKRGRVSRRIVLVVVVVAVAVGSVLGGLAMFGRRTPAKAAGVDNAAATSTAAMSVELLKTDAVTSFALVRSSSCKAAPRAVLCPRFSST